MANAPKWCSVATAQWQATGDPCGVAAWKPDRGDECVEWVPEKCVWGEGERGQLVGRGQGSWVTGTGSQGWQTVFNARLMSIGCVT